ncbi:MAG: phage head completion protein [Pseudomonadota bacterium]
MIAALRTLAVLEAPSEAETVFGGRTRGWTQVAALWIDLRPRGHREFTEGGRRQLVETAEAEARPLAGAARGCRLKAGGEAWRIVAARPSRTRGRMTLDLERSWP